MEGISSVTAITLPLFPDPILWISSLTSDLALTNKTTAPYLTSPTNLPTTLKLIDPVESPHNPSATGIFFSPYSLYLTSWILTATFFPSSPGCNLET